jgi:signal transduction histidine kinase/ActR/RegA family two-component response regulator
MRKDGSIFVADVNAAPVQLEDRPCVVGVFRDVTEQRKAEAERARLEEQLVIAQRLEAVGRLAGGVAHDFNNLLSVILSYAGFAVDELHESDPVREDIVEIQNAGRRAAALTRQLLAFSRKQILEPQVLSLNRVVTDIESMLRRLLGEDIDIEVHLDAALGSVRADPGQLEQVIMNLAVNARDAMPQGGKLTVETANVELDEGYAERHVAVEPGRFVMLSVVDTGAGMDAETKAHIFDPFFTSKERGKGTGLGLSTVYGIVKQSGGSIWVYSEPGRGSTFEVYLPRVDAPVVDVRRKPATALATGSETVLVVEDEPAVCKLVERILRNAGYEVLSATSGGDALLLCEQHRGAIDLLLTDVVMPQMSGRELAERVTTLCPRLEVLYMSGYTDNAIVHHGVLVAGTHFIGKPFAAAELTRKVRDVLDERASGTQK